MDTKYRIIEVPELDDNKTTNKSTFYIQEKGWFFWGYLRNYYPYYSIRKEWDNKGDCVEYVRRLQRYSKRKTKIHNIKETK